MTKLNAKNSLAAALGGVVSMLPLVAAAQVGGNLLSILNLVQTIVSRLIPILVAVALIYFIVGLIRFVIAAEGEARDDGKKMMWWGIVALFVIVSIWGIVTYIADILGVSRTTTVTPPGVSGI